MFLGVIFLLHDNGNDTPNYDNNSNDISTSILVLDDDPDITALLEAALQRSGYNVCGFTDPISALEQFKLNSENYSLVISDLRMPVMNGLEFITNIRQLSPEIKILLMTAFDVNGDSEFTIHFNAQKISGLIQKPISIQKLKEIIKQAMG
jgi:two-component system response regulator PilR (NtrC family)